MFTAQPHAGDLVHEADDNLAVFVADDATDLLDGRILDARTDDTRRVQFLLEPARG